VNDLFIPFSQVFSAFRSRLKTAYNFGYEVIHGATNFNSYGSEQQKLAMVLANPAVLKVFALQCDLFSMGRVMVKDEEGNDLPDDPFLNLIKGPNPFTKTESQFLWDFMFWNMMGTAYTYVDSALVDNPRNKAYFLDPAKIEWPQSFERLKDKMIFSDSQVKEINKETIVYRYTDGSDFKFPFDRLVISFDLTNSIGNFFKGPSRLDALYKIISNAEHVLDSENINIRYTGKFMVAADKSVGASTQRPGMSDIEKKDLIEKMDKPGQSVYPLNAKTAIQQFVSNLSNLNLSQEYLHQYFLIGNMYGIPRDVLEAYQSSTFENQEKARASHVSYCLDPKGNQFMDAFEVFFGYRDAGKNIVISWDHLPFVQVFAKDKADTQKVVIENLNSLLTLGVSIENANKFLGTTFEIEEVEEEEIEPETNGQGTTEDAEAIEGGNGEAEEGEGEPS
jgi:hypothetical protein